MHQNKLLEHNLNCLLDKINLCQVLQFLKLLLNSILRLDCFKFRFLSCLRIFLESHSYVLCYLTRKDHFHLTCKIEKAEEGIDSSTIRELSKSSKQKETDAAKG